MDYWRRYLRVIRLDKIRNEDVREPEVAMERVSQRHLKWYRHSRIDGQVLIDSKERCTDRVQEEMIGRRLQERGDWVDREVRISSLTVHDNPEFEGL